MKFHKIWILLFTFLFATNLRADTKTDLSPYLSEKSPVTATVMNIAVPKDYMEIMQKFQNAVQANQAWFLEYAKKAKPGTPLPYDSQMGITKEEYDSITQGDKKIKLVPDKKIQLSFVKQPDGKIKIVTNPTTPINDLIIDNSNGVTTPYGQLTAFNTIQNMDANSITGPWQGVQWKQESMDAVKMQAKSIKFALGILNADKKNILYYDVLNFDKDKKEQFSFIVFYNK